MSASETNTATAKTTTSAKSLLKKLVLPLFILSLLGNNCFRQYHKLSIIYKYS